MSTQQHIEDDANLMLQLEDYIKSIWNFTPIPLAFINVNGIILEANELFSELLGKTKDEIIGENVCGNLPNEICKITSEALKGKEVNNYEIKINNLKNGFYSINVSTKIKKDVKGKIEGFFISLFDLTQIKKIQNELFDSEEKFKMLFELAPDAYYVSDLKGVFLDGNKNAELLTGYSRKEIIGKSFLNLKLLKTNELTKGAALLAKNLLGQVTGPDEFILIRKDRTEVHVEIRTVPVKLKGKNVVFGIVRDITERKKAEELILKEKTITEMSKLKNQFLMRISHELRHPLVPIVGFASVMLDETPSEIQRKYLEKILSNANQLKDLVNKVIEVISFESGEAIINPTKFKINNLIKKLVSDYSTPAELKGLTIISKINENPEVILDEIKIKMVLSNLLDNAIKYSDKGKIKISINTFNNNLLLTVEDEGSGMTNEELDNIFKYKIEDEKYTIMYKGLGLGLMLVKYIITAHKGTLKIESVKNKGTKIIINLPLKVKM